MVVWRSPRRLWQGFLETILPHLDERRRRLLVGATAVMLGRGGRTKVAELSGVSRPTVAKGANEIETGAEVFGRQRSPGGGAKTGGGDSARFVRGFGCVGGPTDSGVAGVVAALDFEIDLPVGRRSWSVRGTGCRRNWCDVCYIRWDTASRRRPNRKRARRIRTATPSSPISTVGSPPISGPVSRSSRSTPKRKSWWATSTTGAREWQPSGQPEPVRVHDFIDPGLGKAIPYGIYDLSNDEGWVSVGDTADTAEFAANTRSAAGGTRWANTASATPPGF